MKAKTKKKNSIPRRISKAKVSKKKAESKPAKRWEMYRVDMEKLEGAAYRFIPHPEAMSIDEESARALTDKLKIMGIGGRLVHLDGTPDGVVVESWAGIGRVCDATVIEKQALAVEEKGK